MKLTKEQYEQIKAYLPVARGNVKIDNRVLINAILYMAENECKWRGLPKEYGKRGSVYRRVNRWAKLGVLKRLFYALEKEQIAKVGVKLLALDSTSCKVHPDGMGALKKTEFRALGKPRGGWNTQLHVLSADDKIVVALKLSSGRKHDSGIMIGNYTNREIR